MRYLASVWCGEDNGANIGLSVDEIEAEEQGLSSLIGTKITAYTAENDLPVTGMDLAVETCCLSKSQTICRRWTCCTGKTSS